MSAPGTAGARGSVRIHHAWATDIGRVRAINEDSVLAEPPVYLVADGMGGHDAGEVASAIAVEEFGRLAGTEQLAIEDLGAALRAAQERIEGIGTGGPLAAGTTVALVATTTIDDVEYWVAMNLGDSRVYRISADAFEQVSVDHSVVQELVDAGEITAEEARRHPYRNMITRALGAGPASDPDYWLIPIEGGDRMLVCSDGLTGEVPDPVIDRVVRASESAQDACDALVELALAAGGRDNVSVVVVEALAVPGGGTGEMERTRPGARESPSPVEEDTLPRTGTDEEGR